MQCSDNENVCSVKKENNLGFYRLHTIWKTDGFFINITSKDGAWRGEMTSSDVSKMSSLLQLEPEVYLSQCKEALTSHDGKPGMVYSIENGSFAWKKVVDEDSGMRVKMGSVRVEPASFVDTIQNIVHAALNCNKKLQKELNELTQDRNKILENKNDLLSKLNELIEVKNTMENDLYTKFLFLLNSKKKKIQSLENALEECKKTEGVHTSVGKSDNPYEIDTDDDLDVEKIVSKTEKRDKSNQRSNCLSEEAPEEKKVKKSDVITDKEVSVNANHSSINPEPSTSKEFKSKEKEIPLTKDELFDFFFGKS